MVPASVAPLFMPVLGIWENLERQPLQERKNGRIHLL